MPQTWGRMLEKPDRYEVASPLKDMQCKGTVVYAPVIQSVVSGSAVPAQLGGLSEMQIPGPHTRLAESEHAFLAGYQVIPVQFQTC